MFNTGYVTKQINRSDEIDSFLVKKTFELLNIDAIPTSICEDWFSDSKIGYQQNVTQKQIIKHYLANVFKICIKKSSRKDDVCGILDVPSCFLSSKKKGSKKIWMDKTFLLHHYKKFKRSTKPEIVVLRYYNSEVSKYFFTPIIFSLKTKLVVVECKFNIDPSDFTFLVEEHNKRNPYKLEDVVTVNTSNKSCNIRVNHTNAIFLRDFLYHAICSGDLHRICTKILQTQPLYDSSFRKTTLVAYKSKEVYDKMIEVKKINNQKIRSIKEEKDKNEGIGNWSNV